MTSSPFLSLKGKPANAASCRPSQQEFSTYVVSFWWSLKQFQKSASDGGEEEEACQQVNTKSEQPRFQMFEKEVMKSSHLLQLRKTDLSCGE
ncbi:Hypothetical predicted protein [Xyrichtys novacula]|uniref:Uncharacterized protein n=1 Tax=Xyrichtys novacula TaxID=13765 RepID=A0AAV1GG96_XYRNO|nr:Hypothetical predicted protein [Xyrichtys novacula]